MNKVTQGGEFAPEIPIFQNRQALVKCQIRIANPVHAKQHRMNRQEVDCVDAVARPRQVVIAQEYAGRALYTNAGISRYCHALLGQCVDKMFYMLGCYQVVVIQKQRQCATGRTQRQIGSTCPAARHISIGRGPGLNQLQRQPMRRVLDRAVGASTGVDHHDLNIGVGLHRNAGDGLGNLGAIYATDQNTDQWKLLGQVGELPLKPQQRPMRHRRNSARLPQLRCLHTEIGFGSGTVRPQPKGP